MKIKAAYAWVDNDLRAPLFFRAPVWSEHLKELQAALSEGRAQLAESRGTGTILTLDAALPNMNGPWYRVEMEEDELQGAAEAVTQALQELSREDREKKP